MKSGFDKKTVALVSLAQFCCCAFAHGTQMSQSQGNESEQEQIYKLGPADIDCVIQAAIREDVPANVLLAIASVESGKNGQFVRNVNGTDDVGHFQLNSIHFRRHGVFRNVSLQKAAWYGCYNAELAAWFLHQQLVASGKSSYWVRVANYHSVKRKYNAIYRAKLIPLAKQWGLWLQAHYYTDVIYN